MANCFNQWIALREIHERTENRRFHGRVRCAIKLAPQVLGPEFISQTKVGKKAGAGPYKISEVCKLFNHCILKQSCEGKPWRIFTDDAHLAETAKLLGALQLGITCIGRMLGLPSPKKVPHQDK